MIKTTRQDIAWNYLGSFLTLGMNVVILPVILLYLTADELGLWYVFGSIAALVQMVDFGFTPAITRNITYAWSGAQSLTTEGVDEPQGNNDEPNFVLLSSLVTASRAIYAVIALAAGFLLLSIGTVYIVYVTKNSNINHFSSWMTYSIAVSVNLYLSCWSPMLKGIGKINKMNQAVIISRVFYIASAIIGLMLGGGLLWLSFSFLFSGACLGLLSRFFFYKYTKVKKYLLDDKKKHKSKEIFGIIWPNAKKQGIVSVSGWSINRASTLICSTFFGLELTAQYGLSQQLLQLVMGISALLFNAYIPEIASLKVRGEQVRINKLFSRAIVVQWLISAVGTILVIFWGPVALKIIGSESILLPKVVLGVLGGILFLEWNHSTFSTLITLSNKIPFVRSSLISGILILLLGILVATTSSYGIIGLILSQGLVQLSFNNWYWPKYALDENGLTISSIFTFAWEDVKEMLRLIKVNTKQ